MATTSDIYAQRVAALAESAAISKPRRPVHRCASDVHGPGDDECLGARCIIGVHVRRGAVCGRHGEPLDNDGACWECDAEREVQRRDLAEYADPELRAYGLLDGWVS